MKAHFWVFVTDPWSSLDHSKDTSLRLMEEAALRRVHVFWADYQSIRLEDGDVLLDSLSLSYDEIRSARKTGKLPHSTTWTTSPKSFSQIHYRVDPPVDLSYIHPLQILNQTAGKRLVNPPDSLVLFSEKILASEIPELFPKTCVSSAEAVLERFLLEEKQAVLKPLHHAQSKGVSLLQSSDLHSAKETLRLMTENFKRPVLLQEFLPEVAEKGETRLWFIDGRLLASVQKVPARGEFLIDMDRGGKLTHSRLRAQDKSAIKKIGVLLKKHRIRLAAVDWIAGKITDFNITSPGLIVQMELLLKDNLALKIVKALKR
ncbi:hypothetical protein EBZ37_06680 [bacterium]|nr:hypothetical protein [bacterium]